MEPQRGRASTRRTRQLAGNLNGVAPLDRGLDIGPRREPSEAIHWNERPFRREEWGP